MIPVIYSERQLLGIEACNIPWKDILWYSILPTVLLWYYILFYIVSHLKKKYTIKNYL